MTGKAIRIFDVVGIEFQGDPAVSKKTMFFGLNIYLAVYLMTSVFF